MDVRRIVDRDPDVVIQVCYNFGLLNFPTESLGSYVMFLGRLLCRTVLTIPLVQARVNQPRKAQFVNLLKMEILVWMMISAILVVAVEMKCPVNYWKGMLKDQADLIPKGLNGSLCYPKFLLVVIEILILGSLWTLR